MRRLRSGQQDAQRLVDAHYVADALDRIRGKLRDALAFPLEEGRARRRPQERALFLGAQAPVLRDVEERRERGGAELFRIQCRGVVVPGLQHFVKSLNGVIMRILQLWTKWYGFAHGSLLIGRPAAALPAPAARLAAAHVAAHGDRSAEPCSRAPPGTMRAAVAVAVPAPSPVP